MAVDNILIIGGGLTGGTAARTLRTEGHEVRITVVCSEGREPYQRPPLSKEFLLGKAEVSAVDVAPVAWYGEQDVRLVTGEAAASFDPAAHEVTLAGGDTLSYDRLLLATGAQPRRIPLPGAELDGVMTFRTLGDSLRLKEFLKDGGKRVVMVGSGWIGMELAAAAATYGNDVTLLGLEDIPLAAAIGPEIGAFFRRVHESHGVSFRLPASAARLEGQDGRVTTVVTDSGESIPADLVILAVGVVPDTRLAEAAGLELRNGILVDAGLHTSAPDVFAAGDVANALHPFTGEHHRSEHWSNALNGGKVAARSMLGQDAALDVLPYFYTDQFELSLEYSGFGSLAAGTEPVIRGSVSEEGFLAFWLKDGAVVAGMNVNVHRVQKPIKALINGRVPVDPARLADPEVPLEELLPAG
ncbi:MULTISPECIES: FAD-dependent oxidoreductase [Arthrobacter]|uniref:FAD-dependent oxidoreductase n=2 Tax=Arthrobacter TaxID=1663 RepID=A0ABU9KJQ4_9MICC|nr:FAD-dependent oxidoreductase [Arthrobacter sp. YJM1]MDP5227209.1 FAD-dependent oxidoreductase [Arthrobacter sp. YJM1]